MPLTTEESISDRNQRFKGLCVGLRCVELGGEGEGELVVEVVEHARGHHVEDDVVPCDAGGAASVCRSLPTPRG